MGFHDSAAATVVALAALVTAGCAATSTSATATPSAASPAAESAGAGDDALAPGEVVRRRGPGARLRAPAPVLEGQGEVARPEATSGRRMTWWPGDVLYDPYLAAPRQARTSVKAQFPAGKGDHLKLENTLGLTRSIARWTTEGKPEAGTEIQIEAAVFARFDVTEHYDEDASDWRFGFPVVFRDGDLAWKIHLYHLTSHLGDEYIQRTKEKRDPYHLEEAAFGLSWDVSEGSRVYGEAGIAIYASRVTESGRFQVGYEWAGKKMVGGLAPYFAVDLSARNEQDWNPGKTAAVGLAYGKSTRFGLEFYHGRDTQTQFLDKQVRTLAFVFAVDF